MLFAKIFVAFFWADGAQLVQQHNSSLVKHRAKMQMLQMFTKVRSDVCSGSDAQRSAADALVQTTHSLRVWLLRFSHAGLTGLRRLVQRSWMECIAAHRIASYARVWADRTPTCHRTSKRRSESFTTSYGARHALASPPLLCSSS